jgi:hypothetical protein
LSPCRRSKAASTSASLDLDHALPDGGNAFDLGAGGEQARADRARPRRAPVQHCLGQIARRVAHRDHAIGDIEGEQVGVLVLQTRAAEMDVVVPQPRHHIATGGVIGSCGGIGLGSLGVGGHGDDVITPHHDGLTGRDLSGLHINDIGRAYQQIGDLRRCQCRRRQAARQNGACGEGGHEGQNLAHDWL